MVAGEPSDKERPSDRASAEHWRNQSDAAEVAGDYLGAVDAALLGLEQHEADRELQYRAALNLSRTGALKSAREIWRKYRLADVPGAATLPGSLAENIDALGARLEREEALLTEPSERPPRLRAAAARYEAVHARSGGTFPGINAAVLQELGGDSGRARLLAVQVAAQCLRLTPADHAAAYQLAADRATANLLLDWHAEAEAALVEAGRLANSASAVASTRKQLLQICAHKQIDPAILSPLRNRAVIHYTGHMIAPEGEAGRFPAHEEGRIELEIGRILDQRNVGYGHGSLASGADIMIVEGLLSRGGQASVVLPFEIASFRDQSVRPAGPRWLDRFDRCLGRVNWTEATDGGYGGDAEIFSLASHLAMGTAILRAQHLATELLQLAVWDGRETSHPAGTFVDIQDWKRLGLETLLISSGSNAAHAEAAKASIQTPPTRRVRSIMFGDFKGFSGLNDAQTLVFYGYVMRCVAEVLARHDDHIATRNTWGDGLYVVFDDIEAAACCALDLQSALAKLDLAACGLPSSLGLRLGMHAAAVFEVEDPVLRSTGFAGSHISRTARLEPATPPGQVYVTEEFAALMMLKPGIDVVCDYVGLMSAAKGYGRLRMYLLRGKALRAA